MPPKNKDLLTTAEKKALVSKHLSYISEFNSFLPESQKLVYNAEAFNAKLEDPAEIDQYRKGIVRMEKLKRQSEIYAEMESRFGTPPEGRHYLNRNFLYSFKTEDSAEARAYNQRIYREYCENPEKVLYSRIRRLLSFNLKPFIDSLNDEKALIDFYDANQELCEDAFVVSSMINNNAQGWVTPQLKNALNCIKKPLETLSECKKLALAAAGENEYLTLPKLTPLQAQMVVAGNPNYLGDDTNVALKNYMLNALGRSEGVESAAEYYQKFKNAGWDLGKDFFVSYVAEEKNPQTGEIREVSFDAAFAHRPFVTIRKRTADEIWHIKNVSREYEREYSSAWIRNYEQRTHRRYDVAAIERENKGGFFERLFKRTSRQYKEFLKTLKDYNDPNSKDFLNNDKLRKKGEAYKTHKFSGGRTIEDLNATGKGRVGFVDSVLDNLDDMKSRETEIRRDIEANLYEIEPVQIGQPFLSKADVEIKAENKNEIQIDGAAIGVSEEKEAPENAVSN